MVVIMHYESKDGLMAFKNDEEIDHHISFIEKERDLLDDEFRLLEIKNWLKSLNGN